MMGPSPHLAWNELACHDRSMTGYPIDWRSTRARVLAAAFEAIRAGCGERPIVVLSGYRTPSYNASLSKASPLSQHVQGRALDLAPPHGMTVAEFYQRIRTVAFQPDSPIRGLGYYPTHGFVHIDVRDSPAVAQWTETDVGWVT